MISESPKISKERKMNLSSFKIDKSWTLFLDRDGVINQKRDNDYVKSIEEFIFLDGAQEALSDFSKRFGRMVIVTNQQGIGKEIMTHEDLKEVHDFMEAELLKKEVKLDAIYYCPELAAANPRCRKPNIGMAEQAQKDFPEIDFLKSILIGDSITDIEMGKRVNMKTVFISEEKKNPAGADIVVKSLAEFSALLENS